MGRRTCSRPIRWTSPIKKPYAERLKAEQKRTGLRDAAMTGGGMIRARRVAFGVTDSAFIMGSMGSVVGEKLARLIERATEEKLPLIIISGSGGGARMHEGILSLMQMAKVSAALARYDQRRRPVHLRAHQSDDGRRRGQLRLAGRPGLCRAQGPDRLRRPANHQSHDPHRSCPRAFKPASSCSSTASSTASSAARDLKSEIARAIDYCGK